MTTLTLSNISKLYPARAGADPLLAVDDVSFRVTQDEFCSILGSSGCGKTTLLKMIAGFEKPTQGEIHVGDSRVRGPDWRRTVVFQDYALFPWMTAERNIGFGLEMKGVPKRERDHIIKEHIELVGLQGFENVYPHQLSGGMKQRVAVARGLAVDPDVLLMDEPFAALDAQNRELMQNEMLRIWESERKMVVLVTHSIDEAIRLSDRIIVMTKGPGRIQEEIKVNAPRPRLEDDPEVMALKRRIRGLLEGNVTEAA
ncbi:NitT/TauT family transport system ATP-binding protein [Natronocella acetinitrilica]|uniref:NitT/TauT family transport system ATP-binding protein n=1 Tax=Natronocella acetinitrilica TaxID=414046 RepID=A0AAE3G2T8_9GAMM|nr:ABC transporter ATP-binding protein [Natronocella acetinitrilica]MCP1673661.1 NitT/TauT family transport system ATP-binding protein [Natronocella acetinitrilica]